jgi:hypothetical protein
VNALFALGQYLVYLNLCYINLGLKRSGANC